MEYSRVCFICLYILSVYGIYAQQNNDHGVAIKVTNSALKYVGDFAVQFLNKKLEGLRLPDVYQNPANIRLNITNLTLVRFPPAHAHVSLLAGRGLRLAVTDISAAVNASYSARVNMGLFKLYKAGVLNVDVEDFFFKINFLFSDRPWPPHPFMVDYSCESDGDIHAEFKGDWGSLLHSATHVLSPIIEDEVGDQICQQAAQQIDQSIQSMPLQFAYGNITADMGFSTVPTFTDDYLETYHKASIEYNGQPQPSRPPAAPFEPLPNEKMLYVTIRESTVEDALIALYAEGLLKYTHREKMRQHVPEGVLSVLDSACNYFRMCVNELISEDAVIIVPISLRQVPRVSFLGQALVGVDAEVFSRIQLDLDGEMTPLVDVYVNVTVQANLTVEQQLVFADVEFEDIKVHMQQWMIPNIFGVASSIAKSLSYVVVAQIKLLKQQLVQGFPIPKMDMLTLKNTEIMPLQQNGTFAVGTDFDINMEELLKVIQIKK